MNCERNGETVYLVWSVEIENVMHKTDMKHNVETRGNTFELNTHRLIMINVLTKTLQFHNSISGFSFHMIRGWQSNFRYSKQTRIFPLSYLAVAGFIAS